MDKANMKASFVNTLDFSNIPKLASSTKNILERRLQSLGTIYPLFYEKPIHVHHAYGSHIVDVEGNDFLDMYNNVQCVGHSNRVVKDAVSEQLELFNTHTRYLSEGIVTYAERLLDYLPTHINRAIFTNSGSEANDLAVHISRKITQRMGVIVTSNAYHGTTYLLSSLSPENGASTPLDPAVRLVAPPDEYRVESKDLGAWWAAQVHAQIEDLKRSGFGIAALMVDSIMASDGIYTHPTGILDEAFRLVRDEGGFVIADEVQPGMGRMGDFMWGFQRHTNTVDFVTTGKPIANGLPMGGVFSSSDIIDSYSRDRRYFNTFGGNPVAVAAGNAVLNEIEKRNLMTHAQFMGERLGSYLKDVKGQYSNVGHVRGHGLFYAVEFVKDKESKEPDPEFTLRVVNRLRKDNILISATGINKNILKIRPPLVFSETDFDVFTHKFQKCMREMF